MLRRLLGGFRVKRSKSKKEDDVQRDAEDSLEAVARDAEAPEKNLRTAFPWVAGAEAEMADMSRRVEGSMDGSHDRLPPLKIPRGAFKIPGYRPYYCSSDDDDDDTPRVRPRSLHDSTSDSSSSSMSNSIDASVNLPLIPVFDKKDRWRWNLQVGVAEDEAQAMTRQGIKRRVWRSGKWMVSIPSDPSSGNWMVTSIASASTSSSHPTLASYTAHINHRRRRRYSYSIASMVVFASVTALLLSLLPLHVTAASPPSSIPATSTAWKSDAAIPTSTPSTADPCSKLVYARVIEASEAYACFASFNVTQEMKKKQADAIKSYLDLYPYLNLVRTIKVDVFAKLDALVANTTLTSEFHFQDAIVSLFKQLRDAHAAYSPTCYSTVSFVQPWVLAAKHTLEPNPKTVIVIKAGIEKGSTLSIGLSKNFPELAKSMPRDMAKKWEKALGGKKPEDFVGWEVVEVNGVDALTAVKVFSDNSVGLSHTPETRVNFALASTAYAHGALQYVDGLFHATRRYPSDPARSYLLRNPRTGATQKFDAVPWLGYFREAVGTMTRSAYRKQFCEPNPEINPSHHLGGKMLRESAGHAEAAAAPETPKVRMAKFDRRGVVKDEAAKDGSSSNSAELAAASPRDVGPAPVVFAADGDNGAERLEQLRRIREELLEADSREFEFGPRNKPPGEPIYVKPWRGGPGRGGGSGSRRGEDLRRREAWEEEGLGVGGDGGFVVDEAMFAEAPSFDEETPEEERTVLRNQPRSVYPHNTTGFYLVEDPAGRKTGVVVLSGFEMPPKPIKKGTPLTPPTPAREITEEEKEKEQEELVAWMKGMAEGIRELEKKGAQRLVLDVTNNGGGIICVGKALSKYLLGPKSTFIKFDIRLSPSNLYLLDAGMSPLLNVSDANAFNLLAGTTPASAAILKSNPTANSSAILAPEAVHKIKRAGVEEYYSGEFEINCSEIDEAFAKVAPKLERGWAPKHMAVLSNGFCGSTCAMTVRAMRTFDGAGEGNRVRAFVYGGFPSPDTGKFEPFQATTFEGGSVLDFARILQDVDEIRNRTRAYDAAVEAKKANGTEEEGRKYAPPPEGLVLPVPFPMPVAGQILHWESFSTHGGDLTTPDEFVKQRADGHIHVEDPTDVMAVWKSLAKVMWEEEKVRGPAGSATATAATAEATGAALSLGDDAAKPLVIQMRAAAARDVVVRADGSVEGPVELKNRVAGGEGNVLAFGNVRCAWCGRD
ncbi:hypothetical protein HDU96_002722 [Phlyctochytrium bullatum]|nr:hypothetical protein HDU96_002722 [Phlyctochytrium bullatum]